MRVESRAHVQLGDDVAPALASQVASNAGVDRESAEPQHALVTASKIELGLGSHRVEPALPLRTHAWQDAGAMSENTLQGTVLAVCLGEGGIPKHVVDSARVAELGLEGDRHRFKSHGGAHRAVCLFSIEDYRSLRRDGVAATAPGAFGENLLTEGLDYAQLRAGDRLRVGDEVELEIHDVRAPCGTLKSVDSRFPNLMVGRSGFVCRVLRGGIVRTGVSITRSVRADSSPATG